MADTQVPDIQVMAETRVPYENFGLTYEEYRHAYDRVVDPLRKCSCNGCFSPIHVDQYNHKDESWCHVLYCDGDEGVAQFNYEWEVPCYSGAGFSMRLFSNYCDIPNRHMKAIIDIFVAFKESTERGESILKGERADAV